jgi:hypothetical protein
LSIGEGLGSNDREKASIVASVVSLAESYQRGGAGLRSATKVVVD